MLKEIGATVLLDESKPGKPVRVISLKDNQVTDANLALLKEFPALESLYIRENLADADMRHLQALTGLESLNLSECQVSAEGLAHLKD